MSRAAHLLRRLGHDHGHAHGSGNHHDNSAFEGPAAARRYDRMAWLGRPLYRRIAADIAKGTPYGARVLDIGTGPGHLLVALGRRRPDLDLTGVDVSADMIDVAARRLGGFGDRARAVTGDAGALPFPDEAFDLVVTSFSLHHWPDVPAAAAEIGRVLRPGGHAGVDDFLRAPFDDLARAVAAQPVLAGRTGRRSRMPGHLPFQLLDRQVF